MEPPLTWTRAVLAAGGRRKGLEEGLRPEFLLGIFREKEKR